MPPALPPIADDGAAGAGAAGAGAAADGSAHGTDDSMPPRHLRKKHQVYDPEKVMEAWIAYEEKRAARGKKINLDSLEPKEREVIKILQEENGTIFQATLMEKLNMGKVGITRLLDKLEAKQIIERKRRGMNNVVVLRG